MSTIKSSAENLTLNADGANNDIKFQSNGSEVASIDQAGTVTATSFAGSGANLTGLSSFNPDAAVVFNQSGADVDFRVEADNDEYALFIEGANGNVGIGDSSPQAEFSVTTGGNNGSGHSTGIQVRHNGYSGYKSGMTAGDTAATTHSCGFIGFEGGGHTGAGQRSIIFETRAGTTDAAPTKRLEITDAGVVRISGENGGGDSSGRFNVKKETAGIIMSLWNSHTNGEQIRFHNTGGSIVGKISNSASVTSYVTSSDYRLKENVDYTWDATTRLKQLKPARFNFIEDNTNTLVDGFIAHEAQAVVPECVVGAKDAMMDEEYEVTPAVMDGETVVTEAVMGTRSVPDMQGIDQSKLVPLLVKTIQELEARITALEA